MATYWPPKRATQFIFYVGLESVASAGTFQTNPTLAAGDVTVTKDGGTAANIATLPTVTPSGGKFVKVTLSSTEMTADNVTVLFSDAAGGEWKSLMVNLPTVANQHDDIAAIVAAIKAVTDLLPDAGALTSLATATSITTLSSKVLKYFQLLLRKDSAIATDNATELTAINADGGSGSGSFANTTDSVEAMRDRGDTNWTTATGFSTHSAADVRSEIDSNSTQLAAIVADTNELQTDWVNGGRLDLILDERSSQSSVDALNDLDSTAVQTAAAAALTAYDPPTKAELDSGLAALNDLSAAEVNAEVVDALNVDTYAEPSSVPAATASLAAKIGWLMKLGRNKLTQNSSTQTLYADDGTTADNTATVADDGTTFSRGEWS